MTNLMLEERVQATLVTNNLPPFGDGFRLSRRVGFWLVAVSVAAMAALSTAPSALYGIYARKDHLSSLTITMVYSVYAAGILSSLLLLGHISDWYGRRTVLIPAILVALLASLVFAGSSSLPALLIGRVLTGVALGAAVAAATAYLTDLDSGPAAVPTRRSQIVATVANVGGLAVGPLLAGLLAVYVTPEPRMIAVVFTALLILALLGTALTPEGRPLSEPRPRYRPQRLAVPSHESRRTHRSRGRCATFAPMQAARLVPRPVQCRMGASARRLQERAEPRRKSPGVREEPCAAIPKPRRTLRSWPRV